MNPPADAVADGLASFLAEQWGRSVSVSGLTPSSAGARRQNLLFDAVDSQGTRRLVATIVPTGDIELNPIAVEAAVRALARSHGVPVPEVLATCADPSVAGGPFMISECIEGESVPRRVLRLVQAEGIGERVAHQMGQALGRLHSIDRARAPEALMGSEVADPAAVALADAEAAVARLVPDRPAFALGLRWLARHQPPAPPTLTILHTDVRNGNIIVGPDGLRAVLDWEGAQRCGDPMADLAWPALRMWRFREDANEIGGFAGRDRFVAGYEAAGGTFDAGRFEWWKAMGTLRWGLGLAGQAEAHLDGRFSNVVMAASGRRVPELEWDLLMLIRPEGATSDRS